MKSKHSENNFSPFPSYSFFCLISISVQLTFYTAILLLFFEKFAVQTKKRSRIIFCSSFFNFFYECSKELGAVVFDLGIFTDRLVHQV